MVCRDFILPKPASYVFFYAFFNLRNLLYIIWMWTIESSSLMNWLITKTRKNAPDTVPDAQCRGAFPFPAIYFSLGKGLFIR